MIAKDLFVSTVYSVHPLLHPYTLQTAQEALDKFFNPQTVQQLGIDTEGVPVTQELLTHWRITLPDRFSLSLLSPVFLYPLLSLYHQPLSFPSNHSSLSYSDSTAEGVPSPSASNWTTHHFSRSSTRRWFYDDGCTISPSTTPTQVFNQLSVAKSELSILLHFS